MNILSLYGKGNTGKTKTINLLAKLIESKGGKQLTKKHVGSEKEDNVCIYDFNGKIIAITTRGDDVPSLEEDFQLFPKNADIVVCATRSKGKTCDFVLKQTDLEIIYWLRKTAFSDKTIDNKENDVNVKNYQNLLNQNQANEMFDIIINLFK